MSKFSAKYIGKDGNVHGFEFSSNHRLIQNMNLNSNPLMRDMFAALAKYRENSNSTVSKQGDPNHRGCVKLVGIMDRTTKHKVYFDLYI